MYSNNEMFEDIIQRRQPQVPTKHTQTKSAARSHHTVLTPIVLQVDREGGPVFGRP